MLEATGDIWDLASAEEASWVVVTTNGAVTKNNMLVMGAGIAKEAKLRYPFLPIKLGTAVKEKGNVPFLFSKHRVASLPTKPAFHSIKGNSHAGWQCNAKTAECKELIWDLTLESVKLLVEKLNSLEVTSKVFCPRPGCGLAGLDWDELKPHLGTILDDRFVICHK